MVRVNENGEVNFLSFRKKEIVRRYKNLIIYRQGGFILPYSSNITIYKDLERLKIDDIISIEEEQSKYKNYIDFQNKSNFPFLEENFYIADKGNNRYKLQIGDRTFIILDTYCPKDLGLLYILKNKVKKIALSARYNLALFINKDTNLVGGVFYILK